jgi:hypothetical protein
LARRRVVTLFVFALALGGALVLAGLPERTNLVSPGPLTSHHSAIDKGCVACHAVGQGTLADWVHAAVVSAPGAHQSEMCLDCHRQFRHHGLNPHIQDAQALAAITERLSLSEPAGTEPLMLSVARFATGEHRTLACATCHQEHHGREADLTAMTDRQCQVCHARAFHSFSQGHPEFDSYPYSRRTQLYFDHVSHYGSHFSDRRLDAPQRDRLRGCSECHVEDPQGQAMLVRGFQSACAGCHVEQIEDDMHPGVPFLALPALDLRTLDAARIGQWQRLTEHPLASDVPPLMRLLLRTDPEFAEAERQLAGVDLSDLRQSTEAQIRAAESYVWSIKKLIFEAVTEGQAPMRRRLALAMGSLTTHSELDEIVGHVPLPAIVAAQQRWLPDLNAEFQAHRDGRPLPPRAHSPENDAPMALAADRSVASGWYLRDIDLSLRYRPVGHADRLLRSWLDVSVRLRRVSSDDAAKDVFRSLANSSSPGRCMKCHTAENNRAQSATLHWLAKRPAPDDRQFTKFAHRPHVALSGNDVCLSCHSLKQAADSTDSWNIFRPEFLARDGSINVNPHWEDGNFAPLHKSQCAGCHAPGAARDGCVVCHNYHVLDLRREARSSP